MNDPYPYPPFHQPGSLLGLYPSESLPFASDSSSATPQSSTNNTQSLSPAGKYRKMSSQFTLVVIKHVML